MGASFYELLLFFGYFAVLIGVATLSFRKQRSDADFVIGGRSLNFWLTALSAHASDMSSWLFLGYPALIFTQGLFSAWAAIGLVVFMFLNWHFVAPRLRTATELMGSLTLSSYFEARFGDKSGSLRIASAAMSILFFTFYISSGLVGLGILVESLFNLSYNMGIFLGLFIVMGYVFVGGYRTIAWIDLFQGFFLLGVIVFIPLMLLQKIGSLAPILQTAESLKRSVSLFPTHSWKDLLLGAIAASGWGLGYFGQPHILTKFMGIQKVSDMHKAKYLGISWQTIALAAATLIGFIGIYLFPQGLEDPQQVILSIVKQNLPFFFAGLVLCAVLAATTNVMAAQILVVASNLSEDFYKRFFRPSAPSKELLLVSRLSVLCIGLLGLVIAYFKVASIYQLVLYSWSGLGGSFGPLILLSLYRKTLNRYGALSGILVGGLVAAVWPYFDSLLGWNLPSILPAFLLSLAAIEGISYATKNKALETP